MRTSAGRHRLDILDRKADTLAGVLTGFSDSGENESAAVVQMTRRLKRTQRSLRANDAKQKGLARKCKAFGF
jgi:ketosteroid isomerase-like protein